MVGAGSVGGLHVRLVTLGLSRLEGGFGVLDCAAHGLETVVEPLDGGAGRAVQLLVLHLLACGIGRR
jgi:hypothetical protein